VRRTIVASSVIVAALVGCADTAEQPARDAALRDKDAGASDSARDGPPSVDGPGSREEGVPPLDVGPLSDADLLREDLESHCWSLRIDFHDGPDTPPDYTVLGKYYAPSNPLGSKSATAEAGLYEAALRQVLGTVREDLGLPPFDEHGSGMSGADALRQQLEQRCWSISVDYHNGPSSPPTYTVTIKFDHSSNPLGSLTRIVDAGSYIEALNKAWLAIPPGE